MVLAFPNLPGDQDHLLGVPPAEFGGGRQHLVRSPVYMHVVCRLDLPLVNGERFVIQVQHGNTVPLERRRQLILAPGGDLQREPAGFGVPAGLEQRVHLPRQVGDDRIRVPLLGAGRSHLVFLRRLARGRHERILLHYSSVCSGGPGGGSRS
jgi:hypothetical protein